MRGKPQQCSQRFIYYHEPITDGFRMSPKPHASSPELLRIEQHGAVCHVQLARPAKRNALNDALIERLRDTFAALPPSARAVVLSGEGEHFCAGLDLSALTER